MARLSHKRSALGVLVARMNMRTPFESTKSEPRFRLSWRSAVAIGAIAKSEGAGHLVQMINVTNSDGAPHLLK